MANLSCYDKYSIDEMASALNLSKKLANSIRKHFGESLSLNESVKLIEKTSPTKIVVEIDLSRPFSDVINALSELIEDMN